MEDDELRRIDEARDNLINTIKSAPVYTKYNESIKALDKYPGVFNQIMNLRTETIHLYHDQEGEDLIEASERLAQKYEELQKFPEVNAFLEAEEDLVGELKRLMRYVASSMELHVPNL
ncbi:MAG: YlbF family regulator [Eubacteriales bacterium]|jgi:cell fate (sporulation/competence/biofilm development) regulator YlbF (YheA/YmcA/DUF963 family)|nr:YlbF family regulator [Lachnospiraceae bacterium]MDD5859411.1 YlbF family regulator [Eubacteriales bacterium]MCH4063027.1 YlbF family regulator [Lachnospiraceae bacterium]MCH4104334.1 YlbF family regulator [Lachnospiraceae bacterium]MCI1309005.1 YlbF family regulator [Lachnospiraceae bacterium]